MTFSLFFRRKKVIDPTWQGRIVIALICLVLFLIFLKNIHGFLSPNKPIDASIMILEGWLPDYAIKDAAKTFLEGNYKLLITTGGPIEKGSILYEYKSHALLCSLTLIHYGISNEMIVALPCSMVIKDRTYASALPVKNYIISNKLTNMNANLFSLAVHTRRSHLLYKMIFEDVLKIGVVSLPDESYDPALWYYSSQGFCTVIEELISYIYAKFLFNP